mmetsp:Transcript_39997/g.114514  ORF Transcript_39997/g.114514 Transcript_39997/m.114514 type:complete len:261 (+) Transcript_39997:1171-1953(+)
MASLRTLCSKAARRAFPLRPSPAGSSRASGRSSGSRSRSSTSTLAVSRSISTSAPPRGTQWCFLVQVWSSRALLLMRMSAPIASARVGAFDEASPASRQPLSSATASPTATTRAVYGTPGALASFLMDLPRSPPRSRRRAEGISSMFSTVWHVMTASSWGSSGASRTSLRPAAPLPLRENGCSLSSWISAVIVSTQRIHTRTATPDEAARPSSAIFCSIVVYSFTAAFCVSRSTANCRLREVTAGSSPRGATRMGNRLSP